MAKTKDTIDSADIFVWKEVDRLKETILFLAEVVNWFHDVLILVFLKMGFQLSDKDLHFWLIGVLGIITFFIVYVSFRFLEKMRWSTTIFSFIYTFTIMIVFVFAIEIQQAITNRGNMEFADAVIGLWGFLVFFFVYAAVALIGYFTITFIKNRKEKSSSSAKELEEPPRKYRSRLYK